MSRRVLGLIGSACAGAAVMYFADPQTGKRRLSLARDKAVSVSKKTARFVRGRSEDLKNRAYGLYCETMSLLGRSCESDRTTVRHAS